MLAYYYFLKRNFEPVLFGFLLTFFSSFGQTFLISLFVPFILADLAFSNTAFGAYYAAATVISSVLLLRFGHILDDRPVRPFTVKSVLLLAAACLLLAVTWHPAVLLWPCSDSGLADKACSVISALQPCRDISPATVEKH